MPEAQHQIDTQIESAVLRGDTMIQITTFPTTKSHAKLSCCSLMCTVGERKFHADTNTNTNNAHQNVSAQSINLQLLRRILVTESKSKKKKRKNKGSSWTWMRSQTRPHGVRILQGTCNRTEFVIIH
jgi:hypothetical protein